MPDYDKLAQQFGGSSQPSGQEDEFDKLAASLGGSVAAPEQAMAPIPEQKTLAGFGSNLLSSGAKFAGDVGKGLMAAPGLLYEASKEVGGMGARALQSVGVPTFSEPTQGTPVLSGAVEAVKGIPDYLAERYGGPEKILDTLYKDPVGFAADLSTVFGGAGAVAKVGKAGKLAEGLSKASKVIDPIRQASRPAAALGRKMGLPETLYASALKPSKAGEGGIERARKDIATGVREELPVTTRGVGEAKAEDVITDMQKQIKAQLDAIPAGTTADPLDLAIRAEAEVKNLKKFNAVTKVKDQKKIQAKLDEFLEGHDQPMTPQELQEFKQGGYEANKGKYKKRQKAGPETEKQILRMAKEKLEEWAPELELLNEREGAVISLKKQLVRAAERVRSNQMIGIGTPIAASAGAALGGPWGAWALATLKIALDQPEFKSKLAFAIKRARGLKQSKLTKASTAVRVTDESNGTDGF